MVDASTGALVTLPLPEGAGGVPAELDEPDILVDTLRWVVSRQCHAGPGTGGRSYRPIPLNGSNFPGSSLLAADRPQKSAVSEEGAVVLTLPAHQALIPPVHPVDGSDCVPSHP